MVERDAWAPPVDVLDALFHLIFVLKDFSSFAHMLDMRVIHISAHLPIDSYLDSHINRYTRE